MNKFLFNSYYSAVAVLALTFAFSPIQKTNLKLIKSSKGAPVSGISARILRYALIMIAHILSVTETQELAMRMLAENANLNRMMARCARAAFEHGPAQVRIGAFVMKCVEKAARTHYY